MLPFQRPLPIGVGSSPSLRRRWTHGPVATGGVIARGDIVVPDAEYAHAGVQLLGTSEIAMIHEAEGRDATRFRLRRHERLVDPADPRLDRGPDRIVSSGPIARHMKQSAGVQARVRDDRRRYVDDMLGRRWDAAVGCWVRG